MVGDSGSRCCCRPRACLEVRQVQRPRVGGRSASCRSHAGPRSGWRRWWFRGRWRVGVLGRARARDRPRQRRSSSLRCGPCSQMSQYNRDHDRLDPVVICCRRSDGVYLTGRPSGRVDPVPVESLTMVGRIGRQIEVLEAPAVPGRHVHGIQPAESSGAWRFGVKGVLGGHPCEVQRIPVVLACPGARGHEGGGVQAARQGPPSGADRDGDRPCRTDGEVIELSGGQLR